MSKKHTLHRVRKSFPLQVAMLGVLSVISSFAIGIKTAGDIETVSHTEAGDSVLTSDITGDGAIDVMDAIAILEIVQGYEEPTAKQLLADPSGDGALTIEDAMRILHDIASRS